MSDYFDCSNYGLRVLFRYKGLPEVHDVPFTGPGKAVDAEDLIKSKKGLVDFIVTQVFIPEPANA